MSSHPFITVADLPSNLSPTQVYGIIRKLVLEKEGIGGIEDLQDDPEDVVRNLRGSDLARRYNISKAKFTGLLHQMTSKMTYSLPTSTITIPNYQGSVLPIYSKTDRAVDFCFYDHDRDCVERSFEHTKLECAQQAVIFIAQCSFAFKRVMDQLPSSEVRQLGTMTKLLCAFQSKNWPNICSRDRVEINRMLDMHLRACSRMQSPSDMLNVHMVYDMFFSGVRSFGFSTSTLPYCNSCNTSFELASNRIKRHSHVLLKRIEASMEELAGSMFSVKEIATKVPYIDLCSTSEPEINVNAPNEEGGRDMTGSSSIKDSKIEASTFSPSGKCPRCGNVNKHVRQVVVDRLPYHLVLSLSRHQNRAHKSLPLPEQFWHNLALKNIVRTHLGSFQEETTEYRLAGAVVHHPGHYTALWQLDTDEPIHYDGVHQDGRVTTIKREEALGMLDGRSGASTVALLVFKKEYPDGINLTRHTCV